MPSSLSYPGVTPAVWECMKAGAIRSHNTIFKAETETRGTATTTQMGQTVVLRYELDFNGDTLLYSLLSKGFLVPENAIWNGIERSVAACREKVGNLPDLA